MPAECPADRTLSDFVAGQLPPADSNAVSDHVRACPWCATRVELLESGTPPTEFVLNDLGRPQPPDAPADPEFHAALEQLLTRPPPLHAPAVGDLVDDYRLVELLGEGGMGVVFRAIHTRLDKEVALKVIRRNRALDPHAADRFRREMRATARVEHPNLVTATDAGVTEGVQYLVVKYVPGVNLARLVMRDGPLPLERACELIRQAALGLHHAHEHGMVHRDVKPSNLLLGDDGTVRVLDLGLALLPGEVEPREPAPAVADAATSTGDDTLTSPGQQLGTRDYTAPEQLADSHRVDRRADVYSLGCTLAYLLTGDAYRIGAPMPPHLPAETWAKLLATNPADRFSSAQAVVEALGGFCPKPPAERPRRGWVAPVAFAAVLAIVVGLALVLNKPTPPAPPNPEPDRQAKSDPPPPPEEAPPPREIPPPGSIPLTTEQARALQKAWADHLRQPVAVKTDLGMELVLIPPGNFAMSPIYQVTISKPFRMATTEVTFAQYDTFAKITDYKTQAEQRKVGARFYTWKPLNKFPGPQDPVHRLSPGWGQYAPDQPIGFLTPPDVDAFLAWLSAKEGRAYRLPTHAEWVWACRAGTAAGCYWDRHDGTHLAESPGYAWTRNAGADRPRPVGKLLPNAWGLYDMIGNVEELVRDAFVPNYSPSGHQTDPTGPPKGSSRVTCGGSYADPLVLNPATQPGSALPTLAYSNQGFRVVAEP